VLAAAPCNSLARAQRLADSNQPRNITTCILVQISDQSDLRKFLQNQLRMKCSDSECNPDLLKGIGEKLDFVETFLYATHLMTTVNLP